jgi:hypothetical protein
MDLSENTSEEIIAIICGIYIVFFILLFASVKCCLGVIRYRQHLNVTEVVESSIPVVSIV